MALDRDGAARGGGAGAHRGGLSRPAGALPARRLPVPRGRAGHTTLRAPALSRHEARGGPQPCRAPAGSVEAPPCSLLGDPIPRGWALCALCVLVGLPRDRGLPWLRGTSVPLLRHRGPTLPGLWGTPLLLWLLWCNSPAVVEDPPPNLAPEQIQGTTLVLWGPVVANLFRFRGAPMGWWGAPVLVCPSPFLG